MAQLHLQYIRNEHAILAGTGDGTEARYNLLPGWSLC